MSVRAALRVLAGLAVAGLFLWLTLSAAPLGELGRALATMPAGALLAGVLAVALGYAARIWRWWLMLRACGGRGGIGAAAGPFLASFAVNNLVPLRAGDALRAFGFTRRLGLPGARVAATLVVERALDLVALLAFLLAGLALLGEAGDTDAALPPGLSALLQGALGLALAAGLAVLAAPRALARAGVALRARLRHRRVPPALVAGLRFALRLLLAVRRLTGAARLLPLLGLSLVSWAFEALAFLAALRAVAPEAGVETALGAACLAMAAATLMTLVPGMPGHLGTFHYGAQIGFAAFGTGAVAATAAAVAAHALLWLPVTLAGGLWLLGHGGARAVSRARQARQARQDAATAPAEALTRTGAAVR